MGEKERSKIKPSIMIVICIILFIAFLLVRASGADKAYNEYAEELFNHPNVSHLTLNWCEKFPNASKEAIDTHLFFYQEPSIDSDIVTTAKTCEPLGLQMEVMEKTEVNGEQWFLLRWMDGDVKRWGWQKEDTL